MSGGIGHVFGDPPIGTIVYGNKQVIYLGNGEWRPWLRCRTTHIEVKLGPSMAVCADESAADRVVVLVGKLDAVLPLFTAEGERRWAPDWEPVWADESHQHEVGEVWTTAGPLLTTWVTVDTGATHVRYARLAIGDSAGLVTVTCAENGGRTTVTVDYDLTALSDAGPDRLESFAASYDDMLAHWQRHTSRALA